MVKSGKYRGEKVRYPDGVGCCVWMLLKEDDEDSAGICFDFSYENIDDVMKVILGLEKDEEKVYEPDLEYEEHKRRQEKQRKTWWWKLHHAVEDIGVQIVPFDWSFRRFIITRPIGSKNGEMFNKWCKGFHVGPIVVTW